MGGGGGSSRPWDKGDTRSPKKIFRPFGSQFGIKITGGAGDPAPPLDPPLDRMSLVMLNFSNLSKEVSTMKLSMSAYEVWSRSPLYNSYICLDRNLSKILFRAGIPGGTPLLKPYRCIPPRRVWFLVLFCLKTGMHFVHFGLESGMVFKGTIYGSVWAYLSFQFQMNKNEVEICEFEMHLKKIFCALTVVCYSLLLL